MRRLESFVIHGMLLFSSVLFVAGIVCFSVEMVAPGWLDLTLFGVVD